MARFKKFKKRNKEHLAHLRKYFAKINGNTEKYLKIKKEHQDKLIKRFENININICIDENLEFLNTSSTKTTLSYYLTNGNFDKLGLNHSIYKTYPDNKGFKIYRLIDVLEKIIEKDVEIRFKTIPVDYLLFKNVPDKFDFINMCFKLVQMKQREDKLLKTLAEIQKDNIQQIKKKKI